MEDEEMLETTNETENVDTQATEEFEDVELTDENDSENVDEEQDEDTQEETQQTEEQPEANPKKSLKELLEEDEDLQAQFNDVMKTRLGRQKDKLSREYDNKYSRLEDLLVAGLGGKDVEENTKLLENMYAEQGIKLPEKRTNYSQDDVEVLANHDVENFIAEGMDSVNEELDRLVKLGFDNMTARDKAVFKKLDSAKKSFEERKELRSLGISEDVLNNEDFKSFVRDYCTDDMPLTKKYQLFQKIQNKNIDTSDHATPGSMKNNDSKVEKDTFTSEEVDMLRPEDYDDPKIMEKVRKSMFGW